MATQREIQKRIQSVSGTKKITNTMEMVSTSKMRKMQSRLLKAKPYADKLNEVVGHLSAIDVDTEKVPLLQKRANPQKFLILMLTGNRGLCGGFNANIIENSLNFKKELEADNKDVDIKIIGKKGINFFNFIHEEYVEGSINPDDAISFDDCSKIGDDIAKLFIEGEYDVIYISAMDVVSATSQNPHISQILPLQGEEKAENAKEVDYIFEPNVTDILENVLPLAVKMKIYLAFLETSFSEQFARRVAMKNATDAAADMVQGLTVSYNRVRQGKITNEILEIVSGANALE